MLLIDTSEFKTVKSMVMATKVSRILTNSKSQKHSIINTMITLARPPTIRFLSTVMMKSQLMTKNQMIPLILM